VRLGAVYTVAKTTYKRRSNDVATVTERRGWDLNSVTKERKTDREKNRAIRTRQRAIGRELRRMFDEVAKEPIPNDFVDLLRKIDEAGEGGESDS
jgi:hypothetical protein